MKLESGQSLEEKRHWQIVRRDTYMPIDGDIISADDETGDCCVQVPTHEPGKFETKTWSLGPHMIRICRKGR